MNITRPEWVGYAAGFADAADCALTRMAQRNGLVARTT